MDDLDLGATIKGFTSGQKVFKRYTLQKILGRGGMGVVWLAHDEKLDEAVALKFLPDAVKLDAAALDDLKRETKRARQLTHPSIVRIHDFLEDATMAAIAMEAVDGTTFSQLRIERPSRVFEVADITAWVRQLCSALDYAHTDARVVHRDLKPANIMVDQRGRVKITDFGISQSISDSISRVSAQRSSSGTPAYMSPQQMLGGKSSPADDIYSLGATIYELLTGKPPFYAGNLIAQVQSITPAPMAVRRQDLEVTGAPIPAAWEQLVAACLAKEPAGRPRSAAEMLQRLGSAGPAADTSVPDDAEVELPVSRPAGESRVVDLPGGARMEFRPIPAGEFYAGSPEGEAGRYDEESPRPRVKLTQAWWLAKTSVTHLQWKGIMGTSLVDQARLGIEDDTEYNLENKMQTLRAMWGVARDSDPAKMVGAAGDEAPMYYVSWFEAVEFCRRLTEQERKAGRLPEGFVYTLPTEAQWEFACRAGTRDATYAGPMEIRGAMNAPMLDAIAWYGGNSSVRYSGTGWNTADWKEKQYPGGQAGQRNVGLKRANPWGLHDMLGNVWEWCLDLYGKYPGGILTDPIGPATGLSRICRGGAWNTNARDCRAATRNWSLPAIRRSAFGFRVALAPEVAVPAGETAAVSATEADSTVYPAAPTPGQPWRVTLPTGIRLALPWIPPGEFTMGSPEGEPGCYDEEGPRTRVTLGRGFWLGRTPVTHGQWKAVMGTSLREVMRLILQDDRLYTLGGKQQTIRDSWGVARDADPASRLGGEEDSLPMHFVTWEDGMRFGQKLTEIERAAGRLPEGYEYVLPTEAQWEYACRAGTDTATYAGPLDILGEHNAPALDAIAWYGGNSSVGFTGRGWGTEKWNEKQSPGGLAGPRSVGTRQPNPWGLYDLLGNVWEWGFDFYAKYPGGAVTDPTGPATGSNRISRGGAWSGKARDCRSACRNWSASFLPASHSGFRIALAPVLPDKPRLDAAAGGGVSKPRNRERLVLVVLVAVLLVTMLGTCMWTRAGRQSELVRMRTADNEVLGRADTATDAELDVISTHIGRYKELGAPMAEIQDVVARLNQMRDTVAHRAAHPANPAASPGSPTAAGKPGVSRFLAPYSNVKQTTSLASDGTDLYASVVMIDDSQAIVRISMADGTVKEIHSAHNPMGLTVVGDDIVWIDPNSGPQTDTQIWRAPKNGGSKPVAIYTGSAVGQPILDGSGLAHGGDYLYAIDEVGGSVHRLHLDGSGLERLSPARYEGGFATEHLNLLVEDGQNGVLAVDTGHAEDVKPSLLAIDAAGTVSTLHEGAPFVNPQGLACGESVVFVADPGAQNTIWCVPFGGGTPVALDLPADAFHHVGSLVYSNGALYAADSGAGTILRINGLPDRNYVIFGDFARESGMTFTESGLGYHVLEAGQGAMPEAGQKVDLIYRILARDNSLFAESEPGKTVEMLLDEKRAAGLVEGLKMLRIGGRIRLLIPPDIGSGQVEEISTPEIGYIFEAQLIGIKSAN